MNHTQERRISNVIGFDDAPFSNGYAGPVKVVGAVFARLHLTGVLVGAVEKDGADAAETLAGMVARSKFYANLHLLLLQGIAFAGFNVVDVFALHEQLSLPILVVARKQPAFESIRAALQTRVPDGAAKWALIERLGPMEALGRVHVQRVGLSREEAATVLRRFTAEGSIPEPLRTAHLIAGAIGNGESRGRT